MDSNKQENIDYELIPANVDNQQAWHVRMLTGAFVETIIAYGNIGFKEDGVMTFNYTVVYSPIQDLEPDAPGLSDEVGDVLISIIEKSIINKDAVLTDKEGNEIDY